MVAVGTAGRWQRKQANIEVQCELGETARWNRAGLGVSDTKASECYVTVASIA